MITRLFSICCFVAVTSGTNYRLPTVVEPVHYAIKLRPDLDEGVFYGEIYIQLRVKNLVTSILFHSANLSISEVFLDQRNDHISYKLNPELDFIEIFTQNQIAPGNHIVYIKYKGSLLDKHYGFFKARFVHDNETSYLAVTDFQPIYARQAFPCFDEPAFKAQFQITLVTPNDTYTALSNMMQIARFESDEGVVHKFETSLPMSSYLVAFAVTQYSYGEYIKEIDGRELPIRVYSFKASNESTYKILEFVSRAVDYFNNYTQSDYALPKIDFIEYDRNHSGATENWGLVTTRTGFLSPQRNLYSMSQIFAVLAHEVAHFWFGNLVTNYWWDDIWLQEGFAVYLGAKAEGHLLRNSSSQILNSYIKDVYYYDQGRPSNPIVTFLETPSDIQQHFNTITYFKAAVLLHMIENVIGEVKFQTALQLYLKQFAYRTATSHDFVSIIQDMEPTLNLRSFMESYLYQNRYPLVHADENKDEYILTQISCNFKDDNDTSTPLGHKWTIPITYITNMDNSSKLVWFDKDMISLKLPKGDESWIKFNSHEVGLYYMNYSESLWSKIIEHHEEIDKYENLHLLNEAVSLYTLDIVPCQNILNFFNTFLYSKVKTPFIPMVQFWHYAKDTFDDDHTKKLLRAFLMEIARVKGSNENLFSSEQEARFENNFVTSITKQSAALCSEWIKENLPKYVKIRNHTANENDIM